MESLNKEGVAFLNKLYKELFKNEEVQHTAQGTSNKDEAVGRNSDIERLKKLY